MPVGVLGQADRARLRDAFKTGGDVDALAHEIAVVLLNDIAQMHADAELDAPVLRNARIALDHCVLDFDRAAHRVHHAAELDDSPVAGALDHASIMDGDRRINEIAAQRSQPRKRALLVRAGQAAESDHVGGEDRGKFASLRHLSISSLWGP